MVIGEQNMKTFTSKFMLVDTILGTAFFVLSPLSTNPDKALPVYILGCVMCGLAIWGWIVSIKNERKS
jgi:hypothetical protein